MALIFPSVVASIATLGEASDLTGAVAPRSAARDNPDAPGVLPEEIGAETVRLEEDSSEGADSGGHHDLAETDDFSSLHVASVSVTFGPSEQAGRVIG